MEDARSLWGQPESIKYFIAIEERPEDRSVEWKYRNSTTLSFDSNENFMLSSINIASVGAILNGVNVIGISEEELKRNFSDVVLDDDFEENGKDFIISELEISFWVIDGFVDNITIFPEYDDTGNTAIWPSLIN